ncbi:hypothetical protein CNBC0890 [Cryptococcus deneoformans B-3501A]|uniref:CORD and CS domain-containing protein n=1 Tax=Cryptococcus deneoformans (strain JEC21 / ATCC MYA-565) TaxID=214684 RepID=Q5KJJ7_CRYD1|nr:conserved hypothetical protein [Cryptococcus neoformans var. neoformans JEC21]XP_776596.1 hypothetical protein CNBC0890 [Cryptococcus neoformans var. neoformans B-3501A]AAW42582.1 conserved hypothetical protein [Cryptococcus neoformans var. neoformans JEC21]EAL21949.1 hypothetical protein CNBC0890 [Cryptococcus neoformans var. neoformans B-3501A]
MAVLKCTNQTCGKEYEEDNNQDGSCAYHPGGPIFHEGLKSWSCCKETNKPVLEFDAFMALPPCTKGKHTSAPRVNPAAPQRGSEAGSHLVVTNISSDGVETYGTAAPTAKLPTAESSKISNTATSAPSSVPSALTAVTPSQPNKEHKEVKEEEQDDPSVPVPEGARCKRLACGATWEGEEVSRGDGEKAVCRYHPQAAIFHEGSKGYLCCKRRVLEFDEFMKIPGCKEGKHLFMGPKKDETKEEVVNCRLDHYQTPTQVIVSAFAKGADKSRSTITFTPQTLSLSLSLPSNKRVLKTVTLYGPIDPNVSSYRILSTKVEITLVKPKPASWPVLELPPAGTELPPGYALTFGVSGRTGTIGGKEIVLAAEELAKRQ